MKKLVWVSIVIAIIMIVIIVVCIYIGIKKEKAIPTETGSIEIYFCPQDDCKTQLLEKINNATTIHCALYDIDEEIRRALENKHDAGSDVTLILDNDNKKTGSFITTDVRSAYMHNKFCIFNSNEIMTGSMNPTENDMTKNNNNLIFITSASLAENYEAELQSFLKEDFGYDKKVIYPQILFNNRVIENYFCPEDECEKHIIETLTLANESIYFMQFSFTSDSIGSLLLEKSKTVDIAGIFEKQQNSQWSEYHALQDLNVSFAQTSGKLHHKVFIIDKKIVIAGSMNPSKNGNEQNDENIVIMHDEGIAKQYLHEFLLFHGTI